MYRKTDEVWAHGRREAVASFDGGMISSAAGVLLLREVDRRIELVAQRVYALAPGYEDLNDHFAITRARMIL